MNQVTISMEFSKDILPALRRYDKDIARGLKVSSALELFRTRRLSFGKASELAGLSVSDFMELTRREEIPMRNYTEEELKDEIDGAKRIAKKLRKKE